MALMMRLASRMLLGEILWWRVDSQFNIDKDLDLD